jgi:hypothetical protein
MINEVCRRIGEILGGILDSDGVNYLRVKAQERMKLEIELGALTDVPVYCSHKRGRNWAATVKPDPRSPGGLAREFWQRARGSYFYMVPKNLQAGDVVEFGGDYYTTSGHKHPDRAYCVVLSITPGYLEVEVYGSPHAAFRRAKQLFPQRWAED